MSPQNLPCPQCFWPGAKEGNNPRLCPECRFPLVWVAGKYRLMRYLARGGGGTVYLAHHLRLTHEKERVIKVIHPGAFEAKELYIRFQREVEVTALLSQKNPHIVRIYDDFGEEPGLGFFYVMEYLQGHTLKELIQQYRKLPLSLALSIFEQLCATIGAAHREGIVHRDLKPPNIYLIAHEGEPHFAKVIDFGIARSEAHAAGQPNLTQSSMGTPSYMAPEQCMNGAIDGRTDIYALGTILYEMCSGVTPFGRAPGEPRSPAWVTMEKHLSEEPEPLLSRFPRLDIPPALDQVILRALSKAPHQRQESVEELWRQVHAASQRELGPRQTERELAALPAVGEQAFHEEPTLAPASFDSTTVPEEPGQEPPTLLLEEPEATRAPRRSLLWLLPILALAVVLGGLAARSLYKPPKTTRRALPKRERAPSIPPLPRRLAQDRHAAPQPGCKSGATRPCFRGLPGVIHAPCRAGSQRCAQGQWSPCKGAILPKKELCNGIDDDCDGQIDEDFPQRGQPCELRRALCRGSGLWRCRTDHAGLECAGALSPRAKAPYRRVFLRLYPQRLRIQLQLRGKRYWAEGSFCIDLRRLTTVALNAHKYERCTLRIKPQNRSLRIRLKPKSELGEFHDYCAR